MALEAHQNHIGAKSKNRLIYETCLDQSEGSPPSEAEPIIPLFNDVVTVAVSVFITLRH